MGPRYRLRRTLTDTPIDGHCDERFGAVRAAFAGNFSDHGEVGGAVCVVVDGEILGKPESEAEAHAMLGKLSDREHLVYTGLALWHAGSTAVGMSTSRVRFAPLSAAEIHAYWQSGEPQGKAGAYAIQGLGAVFVRDLAGSYTGVMGLPLYETAELLRNAGIPVWHGKI